MDGDQIVLPDKDIQLFRIETVVTLVINGKLKNDEKIFIIFIYFRPFSLL